MANASITTWLLDPNKKYLVGRLLYEQYGDDPVLLALFNSGTGAYHLAELQLALQELNRNTLLEPRPLQFNPETPSLVAKADKPENSPFKVDIHRSKPALPDGNDLPAEVLRIRDEKTQNYAMARQLFTTIPHMDSQDHRCSAALRLLDLMEQVDEAWGALDSWRENGEIRAKAPASATETSVNELTLQQAIAEARNLPTYISKDKAKLAKEKDPKKRILISGRIDNRVTRLTQLKSRLNETSR